jgi:hypothetical protein
MSDNFNFPVKCGYERITPGDFVPIESEDLSSMYTRCQSYFISLLIDTSKSNNFTDMFYECPNLKYVVGLDMSNAGSTRCMFYNCSSIKKVLYLDLNNVTDMYRMFYNCNNIMEISFTNTSNVTDMSYAFDSCYNLTELPAFDTSNVMYASELIGSCISLKYIPLWDLGNMFDMGYFFGSGTLERLTDLDGFKDLGKRPDVYGTDYCFLGNAPNLTHESLMNVINNLYDRRSAGYHELNIDFGETNLNKLTDEEKAIAINKGWVLI